MKKIKSKVGGLKQEMKSKKAICHPDRNVSARGLCKSCYNKWLMDNNSDYAEKQRKNCRDWHQKYKDKKKEYNKKYRVKKDPIYNRLRTLRRYGITLDEYNFILKKQNGVCAICSSPSKEGKNLHIDHCHETGVIRGLLCFRCNFGLSYFGEDANRMKRAYKYLENGVKLSKKLEKIVSKREQEEKVVEEKKEEIVQQAKTKEIDIEDRKEMRELYISGQRLCDIVKKFPQYSRSAINRAAKGQSRSL